MENQHCLCDDGADLEEGDSVEGTEYQVRFLMADVCAAWATWKDSDLALPSFHGTQCLCFISGSRECREHLLFSPEENGVSLSSGFLRAPEVSSVAWRKG